MNDNTFTPNTSVRAQSRTFNVLTVDRECGVVVDVRTSTVTLSRTDAGLVATVDGETAATEFAVRLLAQAQRVWLLEEVLTLEAVAAPIGKPRAHQLHIIMAKVGIPSGEHYAFARAATDDHDIYSLAALTGEQADAVWAYLCFCYPKAEYMSVAA